MTVAVNALKTVSEPHRFLGINHAGQVSVLHTAGNAYGHIVLRGGKDPNYDSVHVAMCEKALGAENLPANIMIDCSHGNSKKDFTRQPLVLDNCIAQKERGNNSIKGVMIESNLFEGRQDLGADKSKLQHGVSITDACIGWDTTEKVILDAAERLSKIA